MILLAGSAHADSDTDFVEASLKLNSLGRYMQDGAICEKQSRDGWNGYPTQLCSYSGSSGATNLPVVLLNPDPHQIARWIVSACRDAGAAHVRHCAERVALQTTCQSGFQFPIAGFVDEGEIFSFRDGVTARMKGTSSWSFAPKDITAAMKAVFESAPEEAGKYARISSTQRWQYAAFVGQPVSKYESLAWIGTTRDEYQSAWDKDSNRLITARVKASLSNFDRPEWGNDFDSFCTSVAGCPSQKSVPNLCAKKWSRWPQ